MTLPAVNVTARSDWFGGVSTFRLEPGLTLAEILARLPEMGAWVFGLAEVAINGDPVPRENWHKVRPKPGTIEKPVVVTIHPPALHGGGNNGTSKQVLTIVATIALIAGTAFIGGGGLALLGAPAFFTGGFGAVGAAAAFGIAGQLALTALAPPPVAGNQKNRNFKPETVVGITGNALAPFDYLPKVIGTVTMSPPFVMQPYTLLEDGIVTGYAIVGLAGYTAVNSVLVNGVDIDEFPDVEYETREGGAGSSSALTLITRSGTESAGEALSEFDLEEGGGRLDELVDQSTPANSESDYHLFQTVGTVDEAILRLAFPAGYYYQESGGDTQRAAIPFRIELKLASSSSWIKGPEIHICPLDDWSKPLRQQIKLVWDTIPGSASPTSGEATYYVYGYTGNQTYNWQANSHFRQSGTLRPAKNVTTDRDGVTLYLSGATFPAGKYDIRIRRGTGYDYESFTASSYQYNSDAAKAAFFDYYLNGSTYEVRVNQRKLVGTVQVEAFTCIKDTHPIGITTDLCLIAIKARKTKIESVSGNFTSRARIFDGVSWGSTYEPTDNPAAIYREVLLGSLNAKPLDAGMVDDAALGAAYQDCASNGYTANGVIQGYSVEQALQAIAATARGVPRQEETWSMLLERDTSAESVVQVLSSRIIRNLVIERSFIDIPHAIRAEYLDATNDYRATEVIVYRDGYNAGNATEFQAIRYDLFVTEADVIARAEFDFAQMIYRKSRYVFEIDWSHLVAPRGALVGLAVDELDEAAGSAVITEVVKSSGNIIALRLDAPVTTPPSLAGITVQCNDGSSLTKQVSEVTESQYIEFAAPFADPGNIEAGYVIAVGSFVSTVRRCKVFDIERLQNLEARVTLLDEAPEIHA